MQRLAQLGQNESPAFARGIPKLLNEPVLTPMKNSDFEITATFGQKRMPMRVHHEHMATSGRLPPRTMHMRHSEGIHED